MVIKGLSIEYDANNANNVFASGDTITGRVVMEVNKQTKMKKLLIMAKGKASVRWTEHYGPQVHITYHSKENYFCYEKYLLEQKKHGSTLLPAGKHTFPFTFDIPNTDLPSSFKGKHGKIIYMLKAIASQPLKVNRKAKEEFCVLSNEDLSTPELMKPQLLGNEKKLLSSEDVMLNVHTKQMGYMQGDNIEVRAEIINNSKSTITPKYYLYEKQCFYTKRKRKVYTKDILKEKGQPVGPRTQINETKILHIPDLLPATLLSCPIIKLEYRLKVVLDVSLIGNPEVKLPIFVLRESKRLEENMQRDDFLTTFNYNQATFSPS